MEMDRLKRAQEPDDHVPLADVSVDKALQYETTLHVINLTPPI